MLINNKTSSLACRLILLLFKYSMLCVFGVQSERLKPYTENALEIPLFEIGKIWEQLSSAGADFSFHYWLSNWYVLLTVTLVGLVLFFAYRVIFTNMNRVRTLGDCGYITSKVHDSREVANQVRRRRQLGDLPPVYPNGWFSVLESHQLRRKDVKSVDCLGLNLAVFRDEAGQAHVVDAYCPHLGANLAIGGQVIGDCLQCPFHGWRFRGHDGKCTKIPYTDSVPEQAKVKSYNVLETNGFVYIWFHAENNEPEWKPPEIESISKGQIVYRGRTEHHINCHIQDIAENGADLTHLPQVHGACVLGGSDVQEVESSILGGLGRHHWTGSWEPDETDKHVGIMTVGHKMKILGFPVPFVTMSVKARQYGPGVVYMTFSTLLGQGAYLMANTPIEPFLQKVVHTVWFQWYIPPVVGKIFLLAEAIMIERDIMIWSHKRYTKKALLTKASADSLLQKHRRHFNQFYSENSPKLVFQKETLEF